MTTGMDLYKDYGRHKGYTAPTLKPKHVRRLDAELWKPAYCRTDMSFLEIGSGTGLVLSFLHNKGVENFQGIDFDPRLLDVIPLQVRDRFSVMDVWKFLEDNNQHLKFDRIILFDVLEHFVIEDCFRLLCKLENLLLPEGGIVLKLPNNASPWGAQFQYGDMTHKTAFTPQSLRQLALSSGLKVSRCWPHPLGSPSRRLLDTVLHKILDRILMTPPEIWTGNFFAFLDRDTAPPTG